MKGMDHKALKHNLDDLMRNGRHYTLAELHRMTGAEKHMNMRSLQTLLSKDYKDVYFHARDSDNIVRYRSYSRDAVDSVPSLTDLYRPAMNRLKRKLLCRKF